MFREITTQADLDALLASDRPVWLFKHSRTCPISAMAHRQVERYLKQSPEAEGGLIVVQRHRDLSQQVAEATGVTHQSPQILLVRSGEVLFHTSHGNITADRLSEAMAQSA